jgi:hypothetical protein
MSQSTEAFLQSVNKFFSTTDQVRADPIGALETIDALVNMVRAGLPTPPSPQERAQMPDAVAYSDHGRTRSLTPPDPALAHALQQG